MWYNVRKLTTDKHTFKTILSTGNFPCYMESFCKPFSYPGNFYFQLNLGNFQFSGHHPFYLETFHMASSKTGNFQVQLNLRNFLFMEVIHFTWKHSTSLPVNLEISTLIKIWEISSFTFPFNLETFYFTWKISTNLPVFLETLNFS